LQSHKETLRRGVKFYTPIRVMMRRVQLSQDDLPFTNLQEIHDYLMQERGVDPDAALVKMIDEVESAIEGGESDQGPYLIPQERIKAIHDDTYREMLE